MKKQIVFGLAFAVLCGGFGAGEAGAALEVRGRDTAGNLLVYDRDLNITWYDFTRGVDHWDGQAGWAAALEVIVNGRNYTDWRLPLTPEPVAGFNITTSEMGHLFYAELGNAGYFAPDGTVQTDYGLTHLGPFEHLVSSLYWSGTESAQKTDFAWYFNMATGEQDTHYEGGYSGNYLALAVRPGDTAVPLPGGLVLLASGLAMLLGSRRRMA